MYSDWTAEDLLRILPGISFFMDKLVGVVSSEKIHFIVNTDLREEVESGIIELCGHYGVSYTKLSDIEKVNGHPTFTGMTQIKDQVLENLK